MNEDNFILEDVDRELTLNEKIEKITSEFEPKAVEYNSSDDGWSVKIQDQKSGMEFWVDVWVDTNYNDVETEWNQYIFDIQDDDDQLRSAIQNDNNVWDLASSEAVNYLEENNEIKQNEKGEWEVVYKTPDGEFYEIYEEDFNDETGDIEGAGRIWNVETGMEREFVFTFDVQGSAVYFNDFSTGDELDIRNENLINEIKSFADDHKDEIEHYITFTIDESKKVESKKVEAKQDKYEYQGYTFIPVGNIKSNLNVYDYIRKNDTLNKKFDTDDGSYNYEEFYKIMPSIDIFKMPELDNILVMPGSNFLFEYTGEDNTIVPVGEVPSDEELRKEDETGYIGTEEDKEVIDDLLDDDKDYIDISSKYGYSFNDYQLYNIATLYEKADNTVKTKIEDVLDNINYHSECSDISANANAFKSSLFESKKTEAVDTNLEEMSKEEFKQWVTDQYADVKDKISKITLAREYGPASTWGVFVYWNKTPNGYKPTAMYVAHPDKHNGEDIDTIKRSIELNKEEMKSLYESKKTEDVAINNGFNVTKYPEVQSLADDIANSIKDREKITIDTVIDAIENWDGGDTSVFTILARVDKDLADKIEADEDDRYEAENQFLGLVEDTLNDMGITIYDEYDESKKVEANTYGKTNADEINETIKDKEFMNNLGITAEDVIKQVEISKKDFDELVNYVNNYKGTFGELYKELQGWNLGDSNVEQDDDNLFDCYYKSLLVTINVDDGKLSVSPIDVYVYPNDITNVDSDELFHLDFDKPIEFDKILKEDATQCGAVDGGRVSIFGEKEKKEEAQDVEYDTDKLLEDILNNVPVEVKHLGNYAYEYKGLYIELRPDTIFTDNTPPEMDFAVFENEEDMNIDYELNIGTGYTAMTPYYRYWEAVMLYCDKLLK